MLVTIDGPAASGKSSVSRELARRLGWKWVSTGAFYRGLGYAALRFQTDLDSIQSLIDLAVSDRWQVVMSPEKTMVVIGNEDVTDLIAHEDVGAIASRISQIPEVRKALLEAQRDCANIIDEPGKGLVAEGRDCGTVVFPNAEVKVYLTARSDSRAERRAKELGLNLEDVTKAQQVRDHQDSTRKAAPMQIPENALVVDTSELNFEQVVDLVEKHVKARAP